MDQKLIDRIIFAAAIFLAAAVLFARFGKKLLEPREPEKTTLVFAQWWDDVLGDNVLSSFVQEFERENPGIKIKTEKHSRDGMDSLLSGNAAAFPDIIALDDWLLADFLRENALASLEQAPGKDAKQASAVLSFMDLLFYNTKLLSEAGFDKPPANRAEFLNYAKAVREKNAQADSSGRIWGAALALSPQDKRGIYRDALSWFWAAGLNGGNSDGSFAGPGAELFNDSGDPVLSDKKIAAVLEFIKSLSDENVLAPGSFIKTGTDRVNEFSDGKIAMMIGSSADLAALREKMGENTFGVTLIPGPASYIGKPVFALSSWYMGISASCGKPDEARLFISFLAEKAPELASRIKAVPGAANGPPVYLNESPLYIKTWDMYEAAEIYQGYGNNPGILNLEREIREKLQSLIEE
jgi:multiple sugar transport system substrate-binding protein